MRGSDKVLKVFQENAPIYLPFGIPRVVSVGLYTAVKKIADEIGLLEKLQNIFEYDEGRLILDISMYLLTRDRATAYLEGFPMWADENKLFSSRKWLFPVDPKTGDELEDFFTDDGEIANLQYIKDADIERFKELWTASSTTSSAASDSADSASSQQQTTEELIQRIISRQSSRSRTTKSFSVVEL